MSVESFLALGSGSRRWLCLLTPLSLLPAAPCASSEGLPWKVEKDDPSFLCQAMLLCLTSPQHPLVAVYLAGPTNMGYQVGFGLETWCSQGPFTSLSPPHTLSLTSPWCWKLPTPFIKGTLVIHCCRSNDPKMQWLKTINHYYSTSFLRVNWVVLTPGVSCGPCQNLSWASSPEGLTGAGAPLSRWCACIPIGKRLSSLPHGPLHRAAHDLAAGSPRPTDSKERENDQDGSVF